MGRHPGQHTGFSLNHYRLKPVGFIRLKVGLRLKPPEGLPAENGLKATVVALP